MIETGSAGFVVDQAVAFFGIAVAAVSYLFKQWWEEAKRISLRREDVYLRFGEKVGRLEAALTLGDDEQIQSSFSDLSSMVLEFQIFASAIVNKSAGLYMGKAAALIAGAASSPDGEPISVAGLSESRTKLIEVMHHDVTWLGKPRPFKRRRVREE